ncbi:MAG: AmmeMemoRadiSam system radical SAM enzyme [Leptospiraceae bacterium]|nr:AmmeMemoRadiSam system radical SAM enzyme [Leptospiraceae bacterium]
MYPGRHYHRLQNGKIQCDLCPRECQLQEGQAGLCFVRQRQQDQIVLNTYGRSSGFCIDPIEKKPLYHFYPGTSVLSFGTAGCNLTCSFCQNWSISKSRQLETAARNASPLAIARAAHQNQCKSVAYTYNDPVIFLEYAVDVAQACRELGIKNVAVSAAYINAGARTEFFAWMDAANVDLKGFSELFYKQYCSARLAPVLESLQYIYHETNCHLEITNLVIPGANDDPADLEKMCQWIVNHLGADVPLHFSAFHPDYKLRDRPRTPARTLLRARQIAEKCGLHYCYTGNIVAPQSQSSRCHQCGQPLVQRDGYQIIGYQLDEQGRCQHCQTSIPGRFQGQPGEWGNRRLSIQI